MFYFTCLINIANIINKRKVRTETPPLSIIHQKIYCSKEINLNLNILCAHLILLKTSIRKDKQVKLSILLTKIET